MFIIVKLEIIEKWEGNQRFYLTTKARHLGYFNGFPYGIFFFFFFRHEGFFGSLSYGWELNIQK